MARPLRIHFSGAWFHVTVRGNERRMIFRTEADRRKWLELAAELPARFGLHLHGYVMMPNHYHLIVECGPIALSQAMQWFNVSYTVWFNRRHRRVGHLFQGRYKAVLVEAERWGLELSRYVHLNPVRIARLGLGKADRAARRFGLSAAASRQEVATRLRVLREFLWSSYRAYAGFAAAPSWLSVETVRSMVPGTRGRSRKNYRAYVEEAIRDGIKESPWQQVQGQLILGGEEFKEKMRALFQGKMREHSEGRELVRRDFAEVIAAVSGIKGEHWENFRDRHGDWGRDLALWLGRTQCGLRLRELGELVGGIDYASVSIATRRWRERMVKTPSLARATKHALKLLNG